MTAKGFASRAIHHGYDPMANEGALAPPLHMTSTYVFETAEAGGEMFAGERAGHVTMRSSSPLTRAGAVRAGLGVAALPCH